MSRRLPAPLDEVVDMLSRLPGLGRKSALRIGMRLLEWPDTETRRLGNSITALRDELALCPRCGGISRNGALCDICADPARSQGAICIVSEWDAVIALEAGGFYDGQYYVLGAQPRPGAKDSPVDYEKFLARMKDPDISEAIIALGSTLEADNAATYIRDLLARNCPTISITRLAQGMPLGAEVKHMDQETLRQSMRNRQIL